MDKHDEFAFLKEEYFHLLSIFYSFDEKSLIIKRWSVTISMAGVGLAFLQTAKGNPEIIIGLASVAAFFFWFIDAHWKTFQERHLQRIQALESYFSGSKNNIIPFQIVHSWTQARKEASLKEIGISLIRNLFKLNVMLPHTLIVIGAPILWWLVRSFV